MRAGPAPPTTAGPPMRRVLRALLPRPPAAAAASTSAAPQSAPPPPFPGLWAAIQATSASASAAGALFTIDTAPTLVPDGGWTFVVRVARALRAKDEVGKQEKKKGGASVNPFLPPDPRLVVCPLPPAHTLLLNKFNVAFGHVLVVTTAYEPQEAPLTPDDAAAVWSVLTSFPGAGGLAFFNRGPLSGASQPHKHVQVVPLPLDGEGGSDADPAALAPFEPTALAAVAGAPALAVVPVRSLPFRAYAAAMPEGGVAAGELAVCLGALAATACGGQGSAHPSPSASYNLLLTRRVALAVPRSAAAAGVVSVNAVGYAGGLLVRSEGEAAAGEGGGAMGVRAACGVAW